nr:hypothetical protein [uncultured Prevotella sp.]
MENRAYQKAFISVYFTFIFVHCTFNISGGNVQILPNATQGIQNFYGDQFAEENIGE